MILILGDQTEQKNQEYEYITVGKGRNRKVVNSEAQTVKILKKSRNTEAHVVDTRSKRTFASNWEMYDTFQDNVQLMTEQASISDDSDR